MHEKATFAAGCFWGVEHGFRALRGVVQTRVGYTGGQLNHPSYEQVCTDTTGHAEAVEVAFDPSVVSYDELLEHFFASHDPTTPDRQGPDVGSQYRSAVFFHDADQKARAEQALARAQQRLGRRVVTAITAASTFWPAEEYHQRYLEKRGVAR